MFYFCVKFSDTCLFSCQTGFKNLQSLEICGGGLTDAGMKNIKVLASLTLLNISQNCNLTNKSLELISGMFCFYWGFSGVCLTFFFFLFCWASLTLLLNRTNLTMLTQKTIGTYKRQLVVTCISSIRLFHLWSVPLSILQQDRWFEVFLLQSSNLVMYD